MASKKDKFLESAQRFVLKGQLDKAIKDYQQVVALDPKEIRYRQRLAELLVRDNRKEEAIVQYEDIGRHYAENSYFLKAIAVYKQIQRLEPGDTAVSLIIASLNNQQGLIGNALAEYAQVLAQLEKERDLKKAIMVLEKMIAIDGENAATRLKYAELLFASGAEALSREAFGALLASLRTADDAAAVRGLLERMSELFPGQQEPDPGGITTRVTAGEAGDTGASSGSGGKVNAVKIAAALSPQPVEFDPSATLIAHPGLSIPESASAPVATPTAIEAQSAFEPALFSGAPDSSGAPPGSEAAEFTSLWEEEIELDLDDNLQDSASSAPLDIDLALDFALSLDSDEDEQPAVQTAEAAERVQSFTVGRLHGWQEIFPDSPSPAEGAMDLEELESHYDLGIAYKEMGLYGEAIKEFAVAAGNPRRRLDCLTLQAICYREMGEPGKAEDLLQQGRSLEVLSDEERMSLSYELAFLFETTGDLDGAIGLYREVLGVNPAFHDVALRLSRLAGDEPLDIIELDLEEE